MGISIKGSISILPLGNGRLFAVSHGFEYVSQDDAHELRVKIPAGMVTDLASIPRFLWALFPPFGTYSIPAIVHDRLCYDTQLSRAIADAVLWQAMSLTIPVFDDRDDHQYMTIQPTPLWQRCLIYGAVRVHWLFKRERVR